MGLEQIRAFLQASEEIGFVGKNRKEMYLWMEQTLVGQQYHILRKEEKGLLRSYLGKMTGLSRAQVTRLIGQYQGKGANEENGYNRRCFPSLYTRADIDLLAEVDEAHEALSGPATQKIVYREYHEYGIRRTSGCASSRCRTFTTCARAGRTGKGGSCIRPPGQCR